MIARIWRGRTRLRDRDAYLKYLNETGIPGYGNSQGNRGVYVTRQDGPNHTEFTLVSLWESERAIERFAGQGLGTAVYYPKDENYLLELEPEVEHVYIPPIKEPRLNGEKRCLQAC